VLQVLLRQPLKALEEPDRLKCGSLLGSRPFAFNALSSEALLFCMP
jgi:hypothetical protein